jgi:cyclic-di-GMP-binding protein
LLLPELGGLKQAASIITARGFCKLGNTLDCNTDGKPSKILINKLVERTARFERFQFSLI